MPDETNPTADIEQHRVANWGDYPRWQCPHCAFDSVNPDAFRQHLKGHEPPPPPKQAVVPIFDRFGNQINQEVDHV